MLICVVYVMHSCVHCWYLFLSTRFKYSCPETTSPYTVDPPIFNPQFAEWYIVSREFVLKHTNGAIDMLYTTEAAANML